MVGYTQFVFREWSLSRGSPRSKHTRSPILLHPSRRDRKAIDSTDSGVDQSSFARLRLKGGEVEQLKGVLSRS